MCVGWVFRGRAISLIILFFFFLLFSGFLLTSFANLSICIKLPDIWTTQSTSLSYLLWSLNILTNEDVAHSYGFKDYFSAFISLIYLSIPESSPWVFLCMPLWCLQSNQSYFCWSYIQNMSSLHPLLLTWHSWF